MSHPQRERRPYSREGRSPHQYAEAQPIRALEPYTWPSLPIIGDPVLTPTNRIAVVTGPGVEEGMLCVRYRENTRGVNGSEYADIWPKWLRPAP